MYHDLQSFQFPFVFVVQCCRKMAIGPRELHGLIFILLNCVTLGNLLSDCPRYTFLIAQSGGLS